MPHVAFVPLTGFRIREQELLALGMSLPGLAPRAKAIGQLPALGLLTLAGMLPEEWTCAYRPAMHCNDELLAWLVDERPDLVAISALTASIDEAYDLCDRLRECGITTVLGGLHATACPEEAARHAAAVVAGSGEGIWRQVLADSEVGQLAPIYRAAPPGQRSMAFAAVRSTRAGHSSVHAANRTRLPLGLRLLRRQPLAGAL